MTAEFGDPTPIYEAFTPSREVRVGDVERRNWLLAVDEEARSKPVGEYDVVLGPAEGGERFTLFRVAEPVTLAPGTCLYRADEHASVELWDVEFRVLPCVLVPPDLVANAPSANLLTVPPEMEGTRLPERETANEALWERLVDAGTFQRPAPPAETGGRWQTGAARRTGGDAGGAVGGGDAGGARLFDRLRSLFD
jgi:hypothetical protein